MLDLSSRNRAFIIAEAGTCHAGSKDKRLSAALTYVKAAAWAGASAVKFQMFSEPERMFCWITGDEARAPRWRDSVMTLEEWAQVKKAAEAQGLTFLASAFEPETVGWLRALEVEASKVASRAAESFPYDDAPKPYLVSTGMHPAPKREDVIVLECESRYPSTARWRGEHVGFSDHSGSPAHSLDALSRGCRLVEVHYFIHAQDAGPDLPASLTLDDLKMVCKSVDL